MADTTALKNRIRAAIKANDNQEITGPVLQQTLLDIVDELDLYPELQNAINTEKEARQSEDTELNNLITGIKNNIDNGYVYAGIATPSVVPVSGKVFYMAVQAGTYTNFSGLTVTHSITILKYNGTAWSQEQIIAIDDEPTAGSDNLIKSGAAAAIVNSLNSIISGAVNVLIEAGECKDDGTLADNYHRVRTGLILPYWSIACNSGYKIHRVCYFDKQGTFIKSVSGYTQDEGNSFVSTEDYNAIITFKNTANTHFEPTEDIIDSFVYTYDVKKTIEDVQSSVQDANTNIARINGVLYGEYLLNVLTFTRGGINSSTGVPQPDTNFARANTDQYIGKKKHTIVCGSAYRILRIYKYSDTEGTFVSAENIQVTSYTYNGEYYVKYEFVKQDGTNFADAHPTGILTEAAYSSGIVDQLNGLSFWKGTQAEYDALGTYDNNTVYFII